MAQINPIAGNIEYNAKKIAKYIKYASKINLDLVVFPELALMGYPIEDTIDRHPVIVEENIKWLKGLAKITTSTTAIVGFVEPRKKDAEGNLINVDDNAICIYEMENGAVGTMTASWTYYGEEDNSTIIYGSEGILKIYDDPNLSLIHI